MRRLPQVAVLLDENTNSGGTRYEAAKGYCLGVQRRQELFAHEDHRGNAIFRGLVEACGRASR